LGRELLQQIHHQVERNEEQSQYKDRALQHRNVALEDGVC